MSEITQPQPARITTGDQITAIVLCYNERIHIGRCIERLKAVADRIVVVDSFSTDGSVEIARELGAEILQKPFVSHSQQFQWGVEQADPSGWVLRIDADEYLEPALCAEICERLPDLPREVTAVEMRRKVFFQGKWIRWGGYYPVVLTRLWRAGAARIEQRWMDEHVVVEHGRTILFRRGDLIDDNLKDLTWWTDKHNGYTTRQMVEFITMECPELANVVGTQGALNHKARLKRMLRNSFYARAPLYLRVILYFLQRYLLRLGFLDGRRGFVFHTLQGFWNFLLVDAKLDEARRHIRTQGVEHFRRHLAERHGIALEPRP